MKKCHICGDKELSKIDEIKVYMPKRVVFCKLCYDSLIIFFKYNLNKKLLNKNYD